MCSRNSFRKSVLVQAVAVALLAGTGTAAFAQEQVAAPVAVEAASRELDIPAQPLSSALEAFAQQTGLQIVYGTGATASNERSAAVVGRYTPAQALEQLLAPTGLDHRFINDNTVTVRPRRAAGEGVATADRAGAETLETINVTGTYLKNIDPASPLIVIDSQLIESRGYASIEDVLRNLPQNFSNRTGSSRALGELEYGSTYGDGQSLLGSSGANLRGLGSRSTLILVDGRRRAASAQGQGAYTDISSIPVSQIERIEVLSDGASAIYGSDAVAGVINIVLKQSYDGTTAQLRHENSSNGADVSRLDLAHTFGFKSGHLTAAIGRERTSPADVNQLIHVGPGGRGDLTDLGGVNGRTRNKGQPGVVYESEDYGIGYHFMGEVIGVIPGGQNGTALDPDSLLPYDPATAPTTYERGRIGAKVDNTHARFSGEHRINEDLRLSYGMSYVRQLNKESWSPTLFDFNLFEHGYNVYVPEANPYNSFGRDVLVGYSFAREFSDMRLSEDQKQTNIDAHVGIDGKLPFAKGWDYELTFSAGREKGRTDALADLTGSMGMDGYERTQAVLQGLNVFGDGRDEAVVAQNRKLLESLVERYAYNFQSRSNVVDALTRGELFSLPAGKIEAAFGAQYREQKFAHESNLGERLLVESDGTSKALFTEIGIPLLKDQPFAKLLSLTVAARHERFQQNGKNALRDSSYGLGQLGGFDIDAMTGTVNNGGDDLTGTGTHVSRGFSRTSPLARLSWKPLEQLRVRATWGESFLVPQAQQQFGQLTLADYTGRLMFGGVPLPEGVSQVVALTGPNVNLKPQVATTSTYGFDWTPDFASGLQLSATYNQTKFDNYIGDPLSGLTLSQVFSNLENMPEGMFTTGENGVLLWDNRAVNFLGRRSRSIDTAASYYFGNDWGDWRVEFNAVRTLELSARSLPSLPTLTYSDSELGPSKWAGDLFVGWEDNSWFASLGAHYSAAHRVLYPLSATANDYNDFTPNENPRTRSASYTTFDAQVGYRKLQREGWLGGVTARLGVQNMFDRAYPFVDNINGFVSNRVNIRGRVLYFDIKKEF
ncbi:TonB-dependent receptor [Stenotrophomonas pictorum]|uniref:TonB-dependent receptor n=1 Tax=Stenotrophomonas pictorum TaxID=86184 RepID=UPI0009F9E93A|nr:TonB-dependent receptor [Stenotrophomonas pictorum]